MAPTWFFPSPSQLSTGASLFSRGSMWALCSLSIFCPRQVCYDRLGCFDSNTPWVNVVFRPHGTLPRSPADVDVRFFFASSSSRSSSSSTSSFPERRLPTSSHDDAAAATLIGAADFDATSPLVFLVHGFFTSANSDWILGAKDAYLRFHGTKVVRVGWNTSPPNYGKAVADARVAGAEIGLLITRLADRLSSSEVDAFVKRIHIIGHSLGAHVASYAANFVENRLGLKIGRITALDPAGPAFQYTDPRVRLDQTDAIFVDAIHTDASADFLTGWGMEQPVGDIDFYPNGGQNQPGCVKQELSIDLLDMENLSNLMACHHNRATYYFVESLIPSNVSVKIVETKPIVYGVNWSDDGELTISASESDFDILHYSNDDVTESVGPQTGRVLKRGNCQFWGVVCNEKLDRFGELKPDCRANCGTPPSRRASRPRAPPTSLIAGDVISSAVTIDGTPTGSGDSTPQVTTLCAPMGQQAALMAAEIARYRESTGRRHLKMYLVTNDAPAYCKN